jgi:hypothetical protein
MALQMSFARAAPTSADFRPPMSPRLFRTSRTWLKRLLQLWREFTGEHPAIDGALRQARCRSIQGLAQARAEASAGSASKICDDHPTEAAITSRHRRNEAGGISAENGVPLFLLFLTLVESGCRRALATFHGVTVPIRPRCAHIPESAIVIAADIPLVTPPIAQLPYRHVLAFRVAFRPHVG